VNNKQEEVFTHALEKFTHAPNKTLTNIIYLTWFFGTCRTINNIFEIKTKLKNKYKVKLIKKIYKH